MTDENNLVLKEIRELLSSVKEGKLTVTKFTDEFSRLFNLELDKTIVSSSEVKILSNVFNVVIWYSPYPDERESIPNYVGEAEVLEAVDQAIRALVI
jgi:hypothetical protein